jgi:Histone-like Protein p6
MRKMMTKDVTLTQILASIMVVENGVPVAKLLPPVTLLGNVAIEKADKEIALRYKKGNVFIYSHEVENVTFEMPVEDFINHATVKGKK